LQISVVQAHDDAAGIAGGFEMVRLLKVSATALSSVILKRTTVSSFQSRTAMHM
jgi:hypothetical protein